MPMAFPNQLDRKPQEEDVTVDVHDTGTPLRYATLDSVYSACVTANASGSSNVMSKKVKARKLSVNEFDGSDLSDLKPTLSKPPIRYVYSRRSKRPSKPPFFHTLLARENQSVVAQPELEDNADDELRVVKKRRTSGSSELIKLGADSTVSRSFDASRLRDCRNKVNTDSAGRKGGLKRKRSDSMPSRRRNSSVSSSVKRWVGLNFDGVDPTKFVGLQCKVYWPLDAEWYSGSVDGYDPQSHQHQVKYADGDTEDLTLSEEKVKFYISKKEMENLNLSLNASNGDNDDSDYREMIVLAASLDDSQEPELGDIIWAKLTGHAMWPAVVVDESCVGDLKGLNKTSGTRSVPVQFFGTHDFARINVKQVISFVKGLVSSLHLKCKKPHFTESLEEAKMYITKQKLPRTMRQMRKGINADDCESSCSENEESLNSGEDFMKQAPVSLETSPYMIGDLQIVNLGEIVKDSEYFQDNTCIWPVGYTAIRKYTSIRDPSACSFYKMEVLRDAESRIRPLFKVTLDDGKQFKGSTPSSCWDKIFKIIRKKQDSASDSLNAEENIFDSGSDLFGFSNPEVRKLIQDMVKSKKNSKSKSKSVLRKCQELPIGYRSVRVSWKDLDKCNVCHMDEEYDNNVFLQCDKCRMMVHARCYGELEPLDGVLWLCNLCRPGAPKPSPPCCLCPVKGGAMKPTTDGQWAHLACAIWIPETCLVDVKSMEPIDGLNRISKDRWKLLCSICGVSYGACIQCSSSNCRVAYHPLCARAAGLCVELEDEDRLHLLSFEEDKEDSCIRLLSFCPRHGRPSHERLATDEFAGQVTRQCSDYIPPVNPSGCARTEPYNHFGRRGRKEPEALSAASLKRLFVENQPYLVGGYCQHTSTGNKVLSGGVIGCKYSSTFNRLYTSLLDTPKDISSMADKYEYMKETCRKRLTFGKSGIHGFGVFAKLPHKAGDMVIEYCGELVRPSIADRREHFIYNSLVGAGTYMFRIDDQRVIDATRAGSIAHLINHSCEPNCYSRFISVNGDEHIIIFAKRDLKQWEELTYDYRFLSADEQLPCYCGSQSCRGVVNDTEAEARATTIRVARSALIPWKGE